MDVDGGLVEGAPVLAYCWDAGEEVFHGKMEEDEFEELGGVEDSICCRMSCGF